MLSIVFCDSSLHETCFIYEKEPPVILPHEVPVTVNEGEYMAVIRALARLFERGERHFIVATDSELLVHQVNTRRGTSPVEYQTRNPNLYRLGSLLIRLLQECDATIVYIPREHNPAGKELERIAHERRKQRALPAS